MIFYMCGKWCGCTCSLYSTYKTFQKSVVYIHDISNGSCVLSDGI